ncbi:MAG: hypothetical protein AB7H80_12595, partial [Candidatus Kapaibacterium sp.]
MSTVSTRLFAVAMVFLLFSLLSFGCGGEDGAHHSEHSDTTAIAAPEKVEGSVENLAEVDSAAESEGKNTEPNAHQS